MSKHTKVVRVARSLSQLVIWPRYEPFRRNWKSKLWRQNADYCIDQSIDIRLLSDDIVIGFEIAAPETVGYDNHICSPAKTLLWQEEAAVGRLRTENGQKVRGDSQCGYLLRFAAADKRAAADLEQRHVFKGFRLLLPVQKRRRRRTSSINAPLRICFPYLNQSIGVFERQRSKEYRVYETEDRRIRANPKSECQDCNECEAWPGG